MMNEFIKLLDKNLEFVSYEIINDTMYINIVSNRNEVICPFCGEISKKVHSRYLKSFQDLPIQDKKVIIILNNRKMFCNNPNCNHKTFAEKFNFISPKGKKTKRLENEIISLSLNLSSITASKYLKRSIANVGKSTICNLLKKERYNDKQRKYNKSLHW